MSNKKYIFVLSILILFSIFIYKNFLNLSNTNLSEYILRSTIIISFLYIVNKKLNINIKSSFILNTIFCITLSIMVVLSNAWAETIPLVLYYSLDYIIIFNITSILISTIIITLLNKYIYKLKITYNK